MTGRFRRNLTKILECLVIVFLFGILWLFITRLFHRARFSGIGEMFSVYCRKLWLPMLIFACGMAALDWFVRDVVLKVRSADGELYRPKPVFFATYREQRGFWIWGVPFWCACGVVGIPIVLRLLVLWIYREPGKRYRRIREEWEREKADSPRAAKEVCTYLSTNEFTPHGLTGSFLLNEQEDHVRLGFGGLTGFWRMGYKGNSGGYSAIMTDGEHLICPHWIYQQVLRPLGDLPQPKKMVLYVDAESMRYLRAKDTEVLLRLVDEQLEKGVSVLAQFNELITNTTSFFGGHIIYTPLARGLRERNVELLFHNKMGISPRLRQFVLEEGKREPSSVIGRLNALCAQPRGGKYTFVEMKILELKGNIDKTDSFYQMIKMVEYIFHYRALLLLSRMERLPVFMEKDPFNSAMGTWAQVQGMEIPKFSYDDEVLDAYRVVYSLLKKKTYGSARVSYDEVCKVFPELRNKFVGHGTMAFSVSDRLLDAVFRLTYVIVEQFYQENVFLERDARLPNGVEIFPVVGDRKVREASANNILRNTDALLVRYWREDGAWNAEYLEYESGRVVASRESVFRLDYEG